MNGRATGTSTASRRRLLRSSVRAITLVAALACLFFFFREVARQWAAVAQISWSAHALLGLAASAVVVGMGGLFDAWAWGWLLRRLALPADSRSAIGVFAIAQFAKYLPGNVGQHIGRLELARRHGWQLGRVGVSLIIENGLALAMGALFAACGLLFMRQSWDDAKILPVALAVLLASLFAALAGQRLLARPPAFVRRMLGIEQPIVLSTAVLLALCAVHIVSHLASTLSVTVLLVAYGVDLGPVIWRMPMIVAIGWLSGYLVPGAPAGLGVRELVLTDLLAPFTGKGPALSAAIAWRVASLIADGTMLLIGSFLRTRRADSATVS